MPEGWQYPFRPIYRSPTPIPAIVAMAFSPEGNSLAFGDVAGRVVIIRDIAGSRCYDFDSVVAPGQPITCVAWLPRPIQCGTQRSPRLIVGDEGGYIHIVGLLKTSLLMML